MRKLLSNAPLSFPRSPALGHPGPHCSSGGSLPNMRGGTHACARVRLTPSIR